MNNIRTDIEKNNAVVYFDQRGSGSAQGNYVAEDVSFDVMVDDVLALAKTIKAKFGEDSKLFLLGHSWGGTLAPAVLLKDQEAFTGWINVAGAHDPVGTYDTYRSFFTEIAAEQIALGNSVVYWESILNLVDSVGPNNLSEIKIPSLILWGKYDLVVPLPYAQEAFDNLGTSDKELCIFVKSAHNPMASEPELFAAKVIEFISSH